MIIRVQSPDGTKRVESNPNDSIGTFLQKVMNAFDLPKLSCFSLFKFRDKTGEIVPQNRKHLNDVCQHGDMIYLVYREPLSRDSPPQSPSVRSASSSSSSSLNEANRSKENTDLQEDEVDKILWTQNGLMERGRDKLCQHPTQGQCFNCAPIEPYNETYLAEHQIKHMSFHSYLRKLTGGVDKGKFALLENISCKIKSGCTEHAPWPQGICTKCQPSAITLNRQRYRHVDNIVFENPSVVDRFLDYWRCSGHQRLGFLYGRYEVHKDVPLGIKATVAAIYEPPQMNSAEDIHLMRDDKSEIVEEIASHLGLQRVGWVFTDLMALQQGTVKHLRSADSYFLSAQECIMAGHYQNAHPNPCRLSPDNYFGSKFVTVCITGDKENHIHPEGYQVSNQCMALVKDNCLVPTRDAPELGYVRESSNEQYVPDVYYKIKDTYGNEVTEPARPLPIEYLLVDVPASTPKEPLNTFHLDPNVKYFPIENRFIHGHIQDFGALTSYLYQFLPDKFLEAMSDFHVLLYIATMDMLPLRDAMEPLLEAVKTKNRDLANQWARSEQWATVEQLIAAQSLEQAASLPESSGTEAVGGSASAAGGGATAMWTCRHCTFLNNATKSVCDMCSLPQ